MAAAAISGGHRVLSSPSFSRRFRQPFPFPPRTARPIPAAAAAASGSRRGIAATAVSSPAVASSAGKDAKQVPKDFLHINDFDKDTIMKILNRAIAVKAMIKSEDRSFQVPTVQREVNGNDLCQTIDEDPCFIRDRILLAWWACHLFGP